MRRRNRMATALAVVVLLAGSAATPVSAATGAEPATPPRFAADSFDLRNARAGAPYAASVGGLVLGGAEGITFRKKAGPAWVRVAADGTLSGTPSPRFAHADRPVVIEARDAAGRTTTARAGIDVRAPGQRLVPAVRTMSWNLWHGGSQVSDGRAKQVRFLLDADVDVVGLQETSSTSARALADALGWDHFQAGADLGIISRYPITARGPLPGESGLAAISARIGIDDRTGRELVVWNAHLGYTPYGPYDACFGRMSEQRLLEQEAKSGRTGQIEAIVHAMANDLRASRRQPVLLMGDFNAPSHLDWTPATADSHCGYDSVNWPTSLVPEAAGLRDSYRVANPDPAAAPGITWSPIYRTFTGGYGHDEHTGEPEPQDRIDFIHFTGPLRVLDSAAVVVGDPAPIPDHGDNEWTSDHAAVLTEFEVR